MKNDRGSYTSSKRDSWVEINLNAIENNILAFKSKLSKDVKLLAVVKADAYGTGASMIVPTLLASGVSALGVASIDEGLHLRRNGIEAEILVLGASPVWAFDVASENNIMISVFSQEHVKACKLAFEKTGIKPKVHVKIDTGMNRIGISPEKAVEFIKQLQQSEFLDLKGVFTHLAYAENRDETKKQIEKFKSVTDKIDTKNLDIHFLNTCGIVSYSQQEFCRYTMARVGIGIYGFMPKLPFGQEDDLKLKNVISLKARIVNLHMAKTNSGVSYSYTYTTSKPETKIATVPLGYADGVARGLSNKIEGILNGKLIKQIGNITMDQMMFDVTDVDCKEGDVITILGEDEEGKHRITIDSWAKILNTIHYELICRLKVRLARIYTR